MCLSNPANALEHSRLLQSQRCCLRAVKQNNVERIQKHLNIFKQQMSHAPIAPCAPTGKRRNQKFEKTTISNISCPTLQAGFHICKILSSNLEEALTPASQGSDTKLWVRRALC